MAGADLKVFSPIEKATPAIRLKEATFRPSKTKDAEREFRSLEMKGAVRATKKNAGRKIPKVATTAP